MNAICPSAIEPERLDHLGLQPDGTVDPHVREQHIKDISAATPVGHVGRPEDVAEVAVWPAPPPSTSRASRST